jgi:hypothetical protein
MLGADAGLLLPSRAGGGDDRPLAEWTGITHFPARQAHERKRGRRCGFLAQPQSTETHPHRAR